MNPRWYKIPITWVGHAETLRHAIYIRFNFHRVTEIWSRFHTRHQYLTQAILFHIMPLKSSSRSINWYLLTSKKLFHKSRGQCHNMKCIKMGKKTYNIATDKIASIWLSLSFVGTESEGCQLHVLDGIEEASTQVHSTLSKSPGDIKRLTAHIRGNGWTEARSWHGHDGGGVENMLFGSSLATMTTSWNSWPPMNVAIPLRWRCYKLPWPLQGLTNPGF